MSLKVRACFALAFIAGAGIGFVGLQEASPRTTVFAWIAAIVFALVATAPAQRRRAR